MFPLYNHIHTGCIHSLPVNVSSLQSYQYRLYTYGTCECFLFTIISTQAVYMVSTMDSNGYHYIYNNTSLYVTCECFLFTLISTQAVCIHGLYKVLTCECFLFTIISTQGVYMVSTRFFKTGTFTSCLAL